MPVVPVGHSDTEPEREPEPVLPRGLVGLRNVGAYCLSPARKLHPLSCGDSASKFASQAVRYELDASLQSPAVSFLGKRLSIVAIVRRSETRQDVTWVAVAPQATRAS